MLNGLLNKYICSYFNLTFIYDYFFIILFSLIQSPVEPDVCEGLDDESTDKKY